MIMCDGGVRSILVLLLVARCLETKYVCIRRMFAFMCVIMTVWDRWVDGCVAAVVKDSVL